MKPAEIKALAGARAIPPLMIVLYHFGDAHHYVPLAAVFGPPVMKGYLWVEFFFALSGFLLVHVYSGRPFRYGEFLKARLARLYPVHLATLLSMLVLMWALKAAAARYGFWSIFDQPGAPMNTAPSFLANLFLVQAWHILPGLTWNAAAWFVSVEFLLCLLFPLYLALAHGGFRRGVVLVAAGIAWLVVLEWNSGVGLDITFNNGIYRGMAGFAIGAGLAMIFRSLKDRPIPEGLHSAVQAGLLALIVAALYFSGPRHSRADIFTAVAFDALVLALAFDKGFLARLFRTAPFQTLGSWSYGIYMGQTFWMQVMRQFDPMLAGLRHTHSVLRISALMWAGEPIALVVVCTMWGALLTTLVERPAHRFLRGFTLRKFAGIS